MYSPTVTRIVAVNVADVVVVVLDNFFHYRNLFVTGVGLCNLAPNYEVDVILTVITDESTCGDVRLATSVLELFVVLVVKCAECAVVIDPLQKVIFA